MKSNSPGTYEGSEYFFHTASPLAKKLLYYMDGCGHIQSGPEYEVIREDYNDYLIMHVVSGLLHVVNEGLPYAVGPDQTVLLNCHRPHRYATPGKTEFYYVHFDGCNTDEIYNHLKNNSELVLTCQSSSEILDPLKLLYSKSKYGHDVSETEASSIIHTILGNLVSPRLKSETRSDHVSQVVNKAIDYIQSHLDSEISVEHLSAQVKMSPFYFSRLFKRCINQSPHEYILTLRLDRAKYLLTSTNQTISEIAQTVGFNSDTGFINAFKGRVGISPGKFRLYHPK